MKCHRCLMRCVTVLLLGSAITACQVDAAPQTQINATIKADNGQHSVTMGQAALDKYGPTRIFDGAQRLSQIVEKVISAAGYTENEWAAFAVGGDAFDMQAHGTPTIGAVIVMDGLQEQLSDDGLAFVIAHEYAHILLRDQQRELKKAKLNDQIADMPEAPSHLETALSADRLTILLVALAGYNPESLIEILSKMQINLQAGPQQTHFMRAHGHLQERFMQYQQLQPDIMALAEAVQSGQRIPSENKVIFGLDLPVLGRDSDWQ